MDALFEEGNKNTLKTTEKIVSKILQALPTPFLTPSTSVLL